MSSSINKTYLNFKSTPHLTSLTTETKRIEQSSAWRERPKKQNQADIWRHWKRKRLHDFSSRTSTGSWDIYANQILLQQCNEEMATIGERKSKRKKRRKREKLWFLEVTANQPKRNYNENKRKQIPWQQKEFNSSFISHLIQQRNGLSAKCSKMTKIYFFL